MDAFPTDPALIETSYASILLRKLSSVISALPPDLFSTETICQIGRYKVYVEDALADLTVLCCTDFPAAILVHNDELRQLREGINDNTPAIDATLFLKLGTKLPLNNTEASQLARNMTDNLKMILKVR